MAGFLLSTFGCGGGGGGSSSSNGEPTVAEGITYSKAMVQDLVNTQATVGTNFWAPQQANVSSSLQGASLGLTRYGRDLDWLQDAIQALDLLGTSSNTGYFTTGLWESISTPFVPPYYTSTEKKWPYLLTKSGSGANSVYSYSIDGGHWTGTVSGIVRRSDGSVLVCTLTDADFPGELMGKSQFTPPQQWSYTWELQGHDVLNLTVTNQGGSLQSATGTVEGYSLTSVSPTITSTLTSATWDEVATGGPAPNTHAFLPHNLVVKIVTGTYSFDGSIDFTDYQTNATAALAVLDGPSWGWHALDTNGATFTSAHFAGKAQNGQGSDIDLDSTVALQNYPSLRLDLPRSPSNVALLHTNTTAKLQIPAQPLLTLTVGTTTNGLYTLDTTLNYTFGTAGISGTGVYFPDITGQASSWRFTATLINERGVQFGIKQDLQGKFTGSVSYKGLAIGTIEDVGFGPRVKYIDGTFESLF